MILGFTGPAGSGKSTLRGYVKRIADKSRKDASYDVEHLSFAEPIKAVAQNWFGWDRQKDERGRKLLQLLGTECGRHYDPEIWTRRMHREISKISKTTLLLIDDVRFQNEAELIFRLGGRVYELPPRNTETQATAAGHESEAGIAGAIPLPQPAAEIEGPWGLTPENSGVKFRDDDDEESLRELWRVARAIYDSVSIDYLYADQPEDA